MRVRVQHNDAKYTGPSPQPVARLAFQFTKQPLIPWEEGAFTGS